MQHLGRRLAKNSLGTLLFRFDPGKLPIFLPILFVGDTIAQILLKEYFFQSLPIPSEFLCFTLGNLRRCIK